MFSEHIGDILVRAICDFAELSMLSNRENGKPEQRIYVEIRPFQIESSQNANETRLLINEKTEQRVVKQCIYVMVVGPPVSTPTVAIKIS